MNGGDEKRELRRVVDQFAREAVEHYHEFKEFRRLYYDSASQIDLLNAAASGFFSDLFYQYLDRIVLNVARLTDPHRQGSNRNLTVKAIHEACSTHSAYPVAEAENLLIALHEIANTLLGWRSKRVAHIDFDVALGRKILDETVKPSEIERFYKTLAAFVDLVFDRLFSEVFPIDAVSFHGVDSLCKVLAEGMALRRLIDEDPLLYHQILTADGRA